MGLSLFLRFETRPVRKRDFCKDEVVPRGRVRGSAAGCRYVTKGAVFRQSDESVGVAPLVFGIGCRKEILRDSVVCTFCNRSR